MKEKQKQILLTGITGLLLSILPLLQTQAKDATFYAGNSKLSTGKWVKLRVSETAIYKLTYADIKAMGFEDPSKVSIHGYGGWILNEDFTVNDYTDDLPEVPVWISGGDNRLDAGEFLLFYGKGVVKWTYSTSSRDFQHERNPYSDYGYYFITDNTGAPQIVTKDNSELPVQPTIINTFDDYALHEQDLIHINASGRKLYGETFQSNTSQNFRFNIDGITTDAASARMSFVSVATITNTSVTATINGSSSSFRFSSAVLSSNEQPNGYESNNSWNWTPDGSQVNVNVTYSHAGYKSCLDFISINVKRHLRPYGGYTLFRNKPQAYSSEPYANGIENASENMFVWEVTPNKDIQQMKTEFNTTTQRMTFNAGQMTSSIREYVVIDPSKQFPTPEVMGEVANQDLHAQPQADMIIIAQPIYWESANRLAQKHYELSGLKVNVVLADQVYNEFSSGTPDATAYRRLMKMYYDRGVEDDTAPRYLLLFGDGSHDNRMITGDWPKVNKGSFLLTYQSHDSLSGSGTSYTSDDYFGYLRDARGIGTSGSTIQIGIGRLPVRSELEARNVVNKIINYMENKNSGDWKNRMVFIGGDERTSSDQYLHIRQSDEIAQSIVGKHPEMFAGKIYYNSFKQVSVNGSVRYPAAVEKLNNKLREGVVLLNFLGHGSMASLEKDILTPSYINQMQYAHTPVWYISSCEFGRYDHSVTSGCEFAVLNATSGAVATIASARVVWSNSNAALNKEITKHIFDREENGKLLRLGDAIRKGKNASTADITNKLNYALLGDPAMPLNMPENKVQIDSINGMEASAPGIQFRSEDRVILKGTILKPDGTIDLDFNGTIQTTLADCINELNSYDYYSDGTKTFLYEEYLNMLYKGTANVTAGRFTIQVPIPRDISFMNQAGMLSFYAISSPQKEAKGYFNNFIVGGSVDRDPNVEINAPEIKEIYLNTPGFADGGVVNETPYFLAKVYDSYGINRSGVGLGHGITLSIDNKKQYTYSLNDYYTDSDNGLGVIGFAIPDSLAPGNHTLTFKVWNILNISTTHTLQFVVETGKAPAITDLTVSANPAKTTVEFYLEYDRPETSMEVTLDVFDLAGTPVWSNKETCKSLKGTKTRVATWENLQTNAGERVKPGIYLYRATISSKYGKESTASKKLIVLAQ